MDRLNTPQIEILGQKSIQTKKSLNRVVEATMMPPKYLLSLSAAYFLIRVTGKFRNLLVKNIPQNAL